MHRVVITGQGTFNPLGKSVAETWKAFQEGHCAIAPVDIDGVERLSIKIGGQIKDYNPEEHFNRQELALYDRYTQFALFAASEAIEQSGLDFSNDLALHTGVVIGTAAGGLNTLDESYKQVYQEKKNRVHPLVVPKLMNNAAASIVSMKYNLQGPTYSIATACASSNHAIGSAYQLIQTGGATCMIAGGSECMICFGGIKVWEALRVMSSNTCRPFSRNRKGMIMGEGAALFVLEEYESARNRGADILAEIIGFSMTSDAKDIVVLSMDGPKRAMENAISNAKVNREEVDYINAHGTGTVVNDRVETAVIKQVFGERAKELMVSSTKSMHGHLIGGTGAIELLACTLALQKGVIAPTVNYEEFDPECDLNVVPNEAQEAKVRVSISNAFAFGGLNAVLVLKRT